MNAYELADELKRCIDDGSTDLVCVCGAVNMLRQQADRIVELEKRSLDLCFSEAYANQATKVTENSLLNRIAELEKEKTRAYDNGYEDGKKVVAWISPLGNLYKSKIDAVKNGEQMISPLYTIPQIKELSDEEIQESIDTWNFGLDISPKDHMFLLCKTILKMANEK